MKKILMILACCILLVVCGCDKKGEEKKNETEKNDNDKIITTECSKNLNWANNRYRIKHQNNKIIFIEQRELFYGDLYNDDINYFIKHGKCETDSSNNQECTFEVYDTLYGEKMYGRTLVLANGNKSLFLNTEIDFEIINIDEYAKKTENNYIKNGYAHFDIYVENLKKQEYKCEEKEEN